METPPPQNRIKASGNTATYKGKPFWSGVVDIRDGSVYEVHTHEEAEAADFHHSFYFSDGAKQGLLEGWLGFIWIEDGKLKFDESWATNFRIDQDAVAPDLYQRVMKNIQIGNQVTASGEVHSWGCLMLDLPPELVEHVRAFAVENISREVLYLGEQEGI